MQHRTGTACTATVREMHDFELTHVLERLRVQDALLDFPG